MTTIHEKTIKFQVSGDIYMLKDATYTETLETLPAQLYTMELDPFTGYYLKIAEPFEMPSKMYGNVRERSNRILKTYTDRTQTTGVLLTGEKGSGKSLLAKQVAISGIEQYNYPTIIINRAYADTRFFEFLQKIQQPTILFFDEFEKTYNDESQEKLLTLLDGVFTSKKLFLFTCNERNRVNTYMINRPSRIYYIFDYEGVELDFIEQYAQDNLVNQSLIPELLSVCSLYANINFDMIKAMIEEMNRYGEKPSQVVQWLNAKPNLFSSDSYDYTLHSHDNGQTKGEWRGNPLKYENINIEEYFSSENDEDEKYQVYRFSNNQLVSFKDGVYQYRNTIGDILTLRRKVFKPHTLTSLMSNVENVMY